jgi:hypothetical protein
MTLWSEENLNVLFKEVATCSLQVEVGFTIELDH